MEGKARREHRQEHSTRQRSTACISANASAKGTTNQEAHGRAARLRRIGRTATAVPDRRVHRHRCRQRREADRRHRIGGHNHRRQCRAASDRRGEHRYGCPNEHPADGDNGQGSARGNVRANADRNKSSTDGDPSDGHERATHPDRRAPHRY